MAVKRALSHNYARHAFPPEPLFPLDDHLLNSAIMLNNTLVAGKDASPVSLLSSGSSDSEWVVKTASDVSPHKPVDNNHRKMAHLNPDEQHHDPSLLVPADNAIAASASTTQRKTIEEQLNNMVEKRDIPWRTEDVKVSENHEHCRTRQNHIRVGILLASRGEEQEPKCEACEDGRGKFSICVALESLFNGSCASCYLGGVAHKCSFRQSNGISPLNITTLRRVEYRI